MAKQTANKAYALIIGVGDYSAFDGSLQRDEGTSDLVGPVYDAHAWWKVCRAFSFVPENMLFLTSPKLDIAPEELMGLAPPRILPPTRQNIIDGVKWLVEQMKADQGSAGFIAYSGHGYYRYGKGLLLCPSDITGQDLLNAVLIDDLGALVQDPAVARSLTVVLDCCFSGDDSPAEGKKLRMLPHPAPPADHAAQAAKSAASARFTERVLTACTPGESAFESEFSGHAHGAFTWALTAVLGQWARVQEGGVEQSHLAYGRACEKVQQLLDVLDFGQHPRLFAPEVVRELAFFQAGDVEHAGETSATEDGARARIQIDPTAFGYCPYVLTSGGTPVGTIVSVGPRGIVTTGCLAKANTEYWIMSQLPSFAAAPAQAMDVTGAAGVSFARQPPSYPSPDTWCIEMPTTPNWIASSVPPVLTNPGVFYSGDESSMVVLDLSQLATAKQVTWYYGSGAPNAEPSGFTVTGATTTFTQAQGQAPATPKYFTQCTLVGKLVDSRSPLVGLLDSKNNRRSYHVDGLGQIIEISVAPDGSAQYTNIGKSLEAPSASAGGQLACSLAPKGIVVFYLEMSYAACTGKIVELLYDGAEWKSWQYIPLQSPAAPDSPLLSLTTGTSVYLYYVDSKGTIYGSSSSDAESWTAPAPVNAGTAARAGGPLTGLAIDDKNVRVQFIDTNSGINEVVINGSTVSASKNLIASGWGSGLSATSSSPNWCQVYYIDLVSQVHCISYEYPDYAKVGDLVLYSGLHPVPSAALARCSSSATLPNVLVYQSVDNQLHALRNDGTSWQSDLPIAPASANGTAGAFMVPLLSSDAKTAWVRYLNKGRVHEATTTDMETWSVSDLSAAAAPPSKT